MLKSRAQRFGQAHGSFNFHPLRRPRLEAAGRCMAPSPGAGSPSPASAPSPARGVGGSSEGLAPFSPAAGAGAAGAGGGAGGACAALLNSSPLLTRLLQGWSERSPDAPSKPTMSPKVNKSGHLIPTYPGICKSRHLIPPYPWLSQSTCSIQGYPKLSLLAQGVVFSDADLVTVPSSKAKVCIIVRIWNILVAILCLFVFECIYEFIF